MQYVTLNNGVEMPILGYGVYQVTPEECERCVLESWGPFAEGRNGFFGNETLKTAGAKYGKSTAQTALRFLIQRGVAGITKSTRVERMRENFDVFDFELSADDMAAIAVLDRGESLFFSHYDPATAEFLIGLGR